MAEGFCLGELVLQGPHSVAEALEVDNKTSPSWLRVSCTWEGGVIKCRASVHCDEPRRVLSLRNTLVDILLCYRAAMDALRAAEPR